MSNCSSGISLTQPAGRIFHNLSICCNCTGGMLCHRLCCASFVVVVHVDFKHDEEALLTFAVQITRALVTLLLLILLLVSYST